MEPLALADSAVAVVLPGVVFPPQMGFGVDEDGRLMHNILNLNNSQIIKSKSAKTMKKTAFPQFIILYVASCLKSITCILL